MSIRTDQKPTDLLCADVDYLVWSASGWWDDASLGSVQDARNRTRGKAAAYFASETTGYLPDVRVWKRHIRLWTRQDAWDYSGRDRAVDDYEIDHKCSHEDADKAVPSVVPGDYNPSESTPSWEFVHRSVKGAIPAWICGVRDDDPPQNPAAPLNHERTS